MEEKYSKIGRFIKLIPSWKRIIGREISKIRRFLELIPSSKSKIQNTTLFKTIPSWKRNIQNTTLYKTNSFVEKKYPKYEAL